MSKRNNKRPQRPAKTTARVALPPPLGERLLNRLLTLPRLARILIAAVPAIAFAALIQPVVDAVYLRFFFDEETRTSPAWVISFFAIGMYFAGWYFIVGYRGVEVSQRRGAVWYVVLSIAIIALVVVWYVVQGISGAAD